MVLKYYGFPTTLTTPFNTLIEWWLTFKNVKPKITVKST